MASTNGCQEQNTKKARQAFGMLSNDWKSPQISKNLPNETIWCITGMPKIEHVMRKRKWEWIGHVLRIETSETHDMKWI